LSSTAAPIDSILLFYMLMKSKVLQFSTSPRSRLLTSHNNDPSRSHGSSYNYI